MKTIHYSVRHSKFGDLLKVDDFNGFTMELEDEDYGLLIEQAEANGDSWETRFRNAVEFLAVYGRQDYEDGAHEHVAAHLCAAVIYHCANAGLVGDRIEGDVISIMDELDVDGDISIGTLEDRH